MYEIGVVRRHVSRPAASVVESLAEQGVATVHEAQGRVGLMKPYMRPIYSGPCVAGTAITVLCQPGDNWMIHVALEHCKKGDILVVAVTSENQDGMFGDLLATSCQSIGVVGLIIDAGVRDIAELQKMGFPVWSKSISAKGTVKESLGSVNIPVVCAGAAVTPGDAIVADDDGVVVVPGEKATDVAQAGRARTEKESAIRRRYRDGELGLDMNNMRERLKRKGLKYID